MQSSAQVYNQSRSKFYISFARKGGFRNLATRHAVFRVESSTFDIWFGLYSPKNKVRLTKNKKSLPAHTWPPKRFPRIENCQKVPPKNVFFFRSFSHLFYEFVPNHVPKFKVITRKIAWRVAKLALNRSLVRPSSYRICKVQVQPRKHVLRRRSCTFYGSHRTTWARSYRSYISGIYLPCLADHTDHEL